MDKAYPRKLPPKNFRRIIEELSVVMTDPAIKLKFIEHAIDAYEHLPLTYRSYPPLAEIAFRKRLLDKAERIWPGSQKSVRHLAKIGIISTPRPGLWRLYRLRHVFVSVVLLVFVCGLGTAVASFFGTVNVLFSLKEAQTSGWKRGVVRKPIIYPQPLMTAVVPRRPAVVETRLSLREPAPVAVAETKVAPYLAQPIWLVEKTTGSELYSNRLQIFTRYAVANIPRSYRPFFRHLKRSPENALSSDRIAGILFHTSESDLVPFRPEMNISIKQKSKRLIKYLRRRKSYNYIIDRFGRVYRLVQEDHAAFHAGNSIWADDEEFYLNLNHAFIGICFEGRDFEEIESQNYVDSWNPQAKAPRMRPNEISSLTEAQLRSGKELTDWLRVKYNISQHNCVPHALVSVNPKKKLIGYHLDLSRGFPFDKFSLSNKYNEPLPSIVDFGFFYDEYFEKIFGGEIWPGIRASEEILERRCKRANIGLSQYRMHLNTKYDEYIEERTAENRKKSSVKTAKK
ncbi:MAG: peptidoglycan recognition family protein [Desulfobacterales bacterium]